MEKEGKKEEKKEEGLGNMSVLLRCLIVKLWVN